MVPLTGLEPVQYRYRGILSPLCLPIPPQRRLTGMISYFLFSVKSKDVFYLSSYFIGMGAEMDSAGLLQIRSIPEAP